MKQNMDFLADILKRYSEFKSNNSGVSLEEFLQKEMKDSGVFSDAEAKAEVKTITETIAGISENRREIQDYHRQGKSTSLWLRDSLDKATKKLSPQDRDSVISSVKKALHACSAKFYNAFFQNGDVQEKENSNGTK